MRGGGRERGREDRCGRQDTVTFPWSTHIGKLWEIAVLRRPHVRIEAGDAASGRRSGSLLLTPDFTVRTPLTPPEYREARHNAGL
jgi:hypothetical protein